MAASSTLLRCRLMRRIGVHARIVLTSAVRPLSTPTQLSTPSQSAPIVRRNMEGFELHLLGSSYTAQPRPVAVLVGWLNAKQKHLHKYRQLYWQRGFDVLTMHMSPSHVIWPQNGVKYTRKLLRTLQENEQLSNRQVLVHGFSIGAFVYTQLQLLIRQQEQSQLQDSPHYLLDLSARIIGLVLDSPAYMDHMCHGIANSLTETSVLRTFITRSLLMYLATFPKSVAFHYQESQRIFHHNSVPTLLLYSAADDISSANISERYVEEWKQKGVPAFTRKFPDSVHVSHYQQYPQEYTEALDMFLDQLEFNGSKVMEMTAAAEMQ